MKNFKIYLISLLIIIFIFSSCKKNENKVIKIKAKTEYSEKEIKSMIREFYSVYVTEFLSKNNLNEQKKKLDSITQIYSTKSLLDSINYEFKNNELDYDPFLNAQDANLQMLKTLIIQKSKQKENLYRVMYLTNEYDSSFTNITLTISKENGRYKISSIK